MNNHSFFYIWMENYIVYKSGLKESCYLRKEGNVYYHSELLQNNTIYDYLWYWRKMDDSQD